jgi:CHAT domain-containing protein
LFSRLRFAPGQSERSDDDGRLEVHELVGLEVNASLVFLSGCETGVGGAWSTAFGQGEDFATLARAFLYSGAANVIATLWRVEDEGAAAFALSFYHHLGEDGTPAPSVGDALALAQRELIRSRSHHAPYYWAGYRVTGSGQADPGILFRAMAQSPVTPSVVE